MICPHQKFINYLKHQGVKNPQDFIPSNLPTGTGLKPSSQKPSDIAYGLWHEPKARAIFYYATFRDLDIKQSLFELGKWKVTDKDIKNYKSFFWNVSKWTIFDFYDYLSELQFEDYLYLKESLGNKPDTVVLKEIGVQKNEEKPQKILNDMLTTAYTKFTKEEDALKWGNLILKIVKELKDFDREDPQIILKELKFELGQIEVDHNKDIDIT